MSSPSVKKWELKSIGSPLTVPVTEVPGSIPLGNVFNKYITSVEMPNWVNGVELGFECYRIGTFELEIERLVVHRNFEICGEWILVNNFCRNYI